LIHSPVIKKQYDEETIRAMRDKLFIIIGVVSLIGVGLELFGVISESIGMFFFIGLMFFTLNSLRKK
tara:strand:- start:44 stop:244 length:201 start_codon:yes stop_codon:yes gene_type:complete